MTLGQIITALENVPHEDAPVRFAGAIYAFPSEFVSYRGSYDQLALVPLLPGEEGPRSDTVRTLLAEARAADGATFTGCKGGDFEMGRDTPVWVAGFGEYPGLAIVDMRSDGEGGIELVTAEIDEYI